MTNPRDQRGDRGTEGRDTCSDNAGSRSVLARSPPRRSLIVGLQSPRIARRIGRKAVGPRALRSHPRDLLARRRTSTPPRPEGNRQQRRPDGAVDTEPDPEGDGVLVFAHPTDPSEQGDQARQQSDHEDDRDVRPSPLFVRPDHRPARRAVHSSGCAPRAEAVARATNGLRTESFAKLSTAYGNRGEVHSPSFIVGRNELLELTVSW